MRILVLECPEPERHIASGAVIPISIELAAALANDQRNPLRKPESSILREGPFASSISTHTGAPFGRC